MKGHFVAAGVWLAIVVAGYFLFEHIAAPEPVVRVTDSGNETIWVPVARDGHYYLEGRINGQSLTFLVDTGASYVSVDAEFARRAGLPGGVTGMFETAAGRVEGRLVRGQTVAADVFEIEGLTVAVMPGRSPYGLLGQNFLRHFSIGQTDGKLVLKMRSS